VDGYKTIYCCACSDEVSARLTDGQEIYPHREDLYGLPFWKCDHCGNSVGCHHKMETNPTQPLGIIPTPELKKARQHIHRLIDPMWQSGKLKRAQIYAKLTKELGWNYHTANIRSVEEARKVYRAAMNIHSQLNIGEPK